MKSQKFKEDWSEAQELDILLCKETISRLSESQSDAEKKEILLYMIDNIHTHLSIFMNHILILPEESQIKIKELMIEIKRENEKILEPLLHKICRNEST